MVAHVVRVDLSASGVSFTGTERDPLWGRPMPDYTNETWLVNTKRETTADFMMRRRGAGRNVEIAVNASGWRPWGGAGCYSTYAALYRYAATEGREVSFGKDPERGVFFIVRRDGQVLIRPHVPVSMTNDVTIAVYGNRRILRRGVRTADADPAKAMLNRELVSREYVDQLTGQKKMHTIDQAIRHRIEEAGIKKLRPGQNTALEIILTGSPETLNSLDEKGLEKWVNESMEWAGKTWGKENIVTAVLHRDEKTPHIHLIVVPIVQGLSRRSRARDEMLKRVGKKVKTKKRNTTGNRLSANEVYTQPRLYAYHTSYAKEVGAHFGLKRGVRGEKGSRQNPQKSIDFNRELARQKLEMETMIEELRSDYSETQVQLQTVTESLAVAQQNLQKVNDDTAVAQANLQQVTEAVAREEEKRKNAKKEADNEVARLKELKLRTAAEEERNTEMEEKGGRLREELEQVMDDLDIAQTHLRGVTADIAQKEERRRRASREADDEAARLDETKRQTAAEQKKCADMKEYGLKLYGAIKQMEGNLEKGRDLEGQIAERENYFRSLGSKALLDLVSMIPQLIMRDLKAIVGKYFKGEVDSFKEMNVQVSRGETVENETIMQMQMKRADGTYYTLSVSESDGHVWHNGRPYIGSKSGNQLYMKDLADYCTRALSPEAKELVASLYKRPEQAPVAQDPVVDVLRKRYGEIAVVSVTPLKTNGKVSGRMVHFMVDGKKRTAVYDVGSKEVCISPGHVKQGTFYLSEWKTLGGKPAVGVNNRVYSHEYRRTLNKGQGIG